MNSLQVVPLEQLRHAHSRSFQHFRHFCQKVLGDLVFLFLFGLEGLECLDRFRIELGHHVLQFLDARFEIRNLLFYYLQRFIG